MSGSEHNQCGITKSFKRNRPHVQENRERWMELCALAAEEQDSDKLLQLTREIDRLLAEKEQRLKQKLY